MGPGPTIDINLSSQQDSVTIDGDGSTTYEDITGTIFTVSKPQNSDINVIVTEQKDDEQLKTAESVSNNSLAGFQATPYQTNLTYGVLYYATAGDQFLYRPNSSAINALEPESSVVVTFRLEMFDTSSSTTTPVSHDEIVVTINRTAYNMIEFVWDSSAKNGENNWW